MSLYMCVHCSSSFLNSSSRVSTHGRLKQRILNLSHNFSSTEDSTKIRLRHKFDLSVVFLIQYFSFLCVSQFYISLQQHERFGSFVCSFVALLSQTGLVMMKKRSAAIAANNFVAEWRFTTEGRSAAQKRQC